MAGLWGPEATLLLPLLIGFFEPKMTFIGLLNISLI
jgi:hypothetical protein